MHLILHLHGGGEGGIAAGKEGGLIKQFIVKDT